MSRVGRCFGSLRTLWAGDGYVIILSMMMVSQVYTYCSVRFSHSVVSDSLRPRGLQHARPPCHSQSLFKLLPIESVMLSNHLILSSPFTPTFNLSLHQGLFKWFSSAHQVAKVLEFQLQHQFFQRIFRTYFLEDGLVVHGSCSVMSNSL